MGKIVAVVLAAGLSSRMGENKLLIPLGQRSVVAHVVEALLLSDLEDIVVVGGRDYREIQSELEKYPLKWVYNDIYEMGQSTSIKAGLSRLIVDRSLSGILFVMGDQPLIDSDNLNAMIQVFRNNEEAIVVPQNLAGKRGAPVLFGRRFFEAFFELEGDQGGKVILAKHWNSVIFHTIERESFFWDVDTEAAYNKVKAWWIDNEKEN